MSRLHNSTLSSRGSKSFFNVATNSGDPVETPPPAAHEERLGLIALISKHVPLRAAVRPANGWRSSLLPSSILQATNWPLWLMGRRSLKPKNQPMAAPPPLASFGKIRLRRRALWQTANLMLWAT